MKPRAPIIHAQRAKRKGGGNEGTAKSRATPALSPPSFPRKRESKRLATRNQVRIEASGSLLPSWEKARMRVSPRASAALRAGRPRSQPALSPPVIPAKAGIQTPAAKPATRNQVQTAVIGSLLPLREKARMRVSPRASAALQARRPRSQPALPPVIPAKAGIQTPAAKPATRNQVQIAVIGSLLPLWEKARMRVSPRASAALRAGRPRSQPALSPPVIPAKAGIQTVATKTAIRNQAQIPASGSLLPLWEKARMRVSPRASAALRAGRPRSQPALPSVIPAKAGIHKRGEQPSRPKPPAPSSPPKSPLRLCAFAPLR